MSATRKLTGLAELTLKEAGNSHWLEIADLLSECTASRSEASQRLKEIWGADDKPTYRSKISCLAHPMDPVSFERAREVKTGINDLMTLARGNARFDGKKVVRKSKDSRGGANRQAPQDRLAAKLRGALKDARAAGILEATAARLSQSAIAEVFNTR